MKIITVFSQVYGDLGVAYGADSQPINIKEITTLFTGNFCPSLIGYFSSKHVVDDEDQGVTIQNDYSDDRGAHQSALPRECDFLFDFATTLGNVCWRNPQNGS